MIKSSIGNLGKTVYSLHLGKVSGRNWLIEQGFKQCQNQNYYEKDGVFTHYNRFLKYWVVDGDVNKLLESI